MTPVRCASERRCLGDHDGRGAWTEPPLCHPCLAMAAADVWGLVYDYADLEQLLPGTVTGRRDTMITQTREAPIPYNVHADALQRGIWHALTTWEEVVREYVNATPLPLSAQVRHGYAVQRAAKYLRDRVAILSRVEPIAVFPVGSTTPEDQSGLQGLETLRSLHRQARAMLGLTKRIEIMPGQCPACRVDGGLRRESGSETVYCDLCYATETWDDHQRRLGMLDR